MEARCDLGVQTENKLLPTTERLQPPSESTIDQSLLTADITSSGLTGTERDNDTANDEDGAGPGFSRLIVLVRTSHPPPQFLVAIVASSVLAAPPFLLGLVSSRVLAALPDETTRARPPLPVGAM